MPITFYALSGSPYAWRVWFALEHKHLPYDLRMLSLHTGDLTKPEYRAISKREKVPAIVDEGFSLYESAAIVEYLDSAYPEAGDPLLPREPRAAAIVRRLVCEADNYVQPLLEALVEQVLFRQEAQRDLEAITRAAAALSSEIARWEVPGPWLAGDGPTAADYALYPMLALARRLEIRFGLFAIVAAFPAAIAAWMKRVEALPQFERTYPPHWRA
jgi:glutathione S-transferase